MSQAECPRIFLICPFSPTAKHGGAVILSSLFKRYPSRKIFWYSVSQKVSARFSRYPVSNVPWLIRLLFKQKIIALHRSLPIVHRLVPLRKIQTYAFRVVTSIIKSRIDSFKPDLLLFYSDPVYLELYSLLAKHINIPFHLTVHDDPVLATNFDSYKIYSLDEVKQLFAFLIQNASSCDVVSARMQSKYKELFNVDSVVVTRGIEIRSHHESPNRSIEAKINILMGGGAWHNALSDQELQNDPLQIFLNTLDRLNTQSDYQFCMNLVGSFGVPYRNRSLQTYDWMSEENYINFMQSMHIGYADDIFTLNTGSLFAQFSFPTKIVTYICFGLPFFYHGPKDSTVGDFLSEYHAGIVIESLDVNEIEKALMYIIDHYDDMQKECLRATQAVFNMQEIFDGFLDFVNARLLKSHQKAIY